MSKIKAKTNKACSKRYKRTATGKYLAKQSGIKHINTKMSSSVKRKLRRAKTLNKANTARLKMLLPHA